MRIVTIFPAIFPPFPSVSVDRWGVVSFKGALDVPVAPLELDLLAGALSTLPDPPSLLTIEDIPGQAPFA